MNPSDYKYKIEMHCHAYPASRCSHASPEQLVDLYKAAGYDAVVLTDHINYTYRLRERYASDYDAAEHFLSCYRQAKARGDEVGLKVLLGMEFCDPATGRDILIYGVDEKFVHDTIPYVNASLKELRNDLKGEDTVLINAHPFRSEIAELEDDVLDGIEVFNHNPQDHDKNGLVARYARDHEVGIITGGSDFHIPGEEDMICLRTKVLPKDSFELARILKSMDYVLDISGNIIIPYGFKGE